MTIEDRIDGLAEQLDRIEAGLGVAPVVVDRHGVAAMLNVSTRTLNRLISEGRFTVEPVWWLDTARWDREAVRVWAVSANSKQGRDAAAEANRKAA